MTDNQFGKSARQSALEGLQQAKIRVISAGWSGTEEELAEARQNLEAWEYRLAQTGGMP